MTIRSETFRRKRNLLLAYASELAHPLLKLYAGGRARATTSHPEEWRTGLLVGADHIGDLLYRSSSLEALAQAFPHCRWDFVASSPGAEILWNNPFIAHVHSSMEEAVKAMAYDAVICYDTGTYWQHLQEAVRAGIPNRVSYVHKGFSAWSTHPIEIHYPQAFPAYFRDMVADLAGIPADWSLRPRAYPSVEDQRLAQELHDELGTQSGSIPVISCFVTSRQAAGVWPAGNYFRTLELIQARTPIRVLLNGAPGDRPQLEGLLGNSKLEADIICGRLPLLAGVAFLAGCDAVFSTDSGPRHLANAAGIPAFFVRNLAFHPVEAGVYCETDRDLTSHLGQCDDVNKALASVTPAFVAEAMIRKLGLNSSPP